MRTFRNILRTLLFILVITMAGVSIAIQIPSVQSRLASRAAQWLSEKTGAQVSIGEVNFLLFNKLLVNDLLIKTTSSDTLLHTKKLSVSLSAFNPLRKRIAFRNILLSDGSFHLIMQNNSTNIESMFPPSSIEDTVSKPFDWEFTAANVDLEHFAYHMTDRDSGPSHNNPESIDFMDMHIRDIDINIRNARLSNGLLEARLDNLNGRERSGYLIRHLEGDVSVDNREARVENLVILDNFSHIKAHYFLMHYGNVENLADYINRVVMELDMDDAFLSFKTIRYYAWTLPEYFILPLRATGKVTGTVSNLSADKLDVRSPSGKTQVLCGFKLRGLPEVEESTLQVDIEKIDSDIGDLNDVLYSIARVDLKFLEENAGSRTPFRFRGRLAGLLTDFVVDGDLQGDFGDLSLDIVINNNAYPDGVLLSGLIRTEDLDLGRFTGVPGLEECSLYTRTSAAFREGGIRDLYVLIDTLSVSSLEFNNYTFRDFKMMGELRNGIFDGRMSASDPNLHFLFQGRADLTRSAGTSANFFANIAYADLNRLNLYKSDSMAVLSGLVRADFSHLNTMGDIEGTIQATGLSFINSRGTHNLDSFYLDSERTADSTAFRLTLESDALAADYSGSEGFMSFLSRIASRNLFRYLPAWFTSYTDEGPVPDFDSPASLEMTVRNSVFFEELLLPGLYISPGTSISLQDRGKDNVRALIRSDRIGYLRHNLSHLNFIAEAGARDLQVEVECGNLTLGAAKADTVSIAAAAGGDRVFLNLHYNRNDGKTNYAHLESALHFSRDHSLRQPLITAILSSDTIHINGKNWKLHSDSILIAQRNLVLNNVVLEHKGNNAQKESLSINGALSESAGDTLRVELSRFDAGMFNTLMPAEYPFTFRGSFTGTGYVTDFYGNSHFFADIQGNDLFINDTLAGNLRLMSSWDKQAAHLKLGASTTLPGGQRPLLATGSYTPSTKHVDMNVSFRDFEAALAAPFLTGLVSDVHGKISGDMLLTGTLPDLDLTSDNTTVDNLTFTIDYTRVPYSVSGPVHLTPGGLSLPKDTLRDSYGHYAIVQGGLQYKHFRDIKANLDLNFVNLHGLNLGEKDNDIFYGQAFATGSLLLKGPLDDILLDLSIRPEPNTSIHIPLSSASEAKQTDLLTFVQPDNSYTGRDPYILAALEEKNNKANNSRFTFNMKTELTPDAEILLEINKMTGDVISARGTGAINLGIDPRDDSFSILGDCTVESGNYLFGLQGIISKRFQIVPGGTISFNGDVENTQLNLTASYKTKASLNTLLADTTMVSNRRDVDCQILMSGNLMNPTLGFNIEIEDIDPMTRARVESALSTDDKMMRQFVTLLISSSFMPEQESGIVNNSNILYSNATEILSNQLNNIFAQLNIPLDVGFNYQPGQSGDVFDVAISTQLFNNRVVINGNMGNNPYTSNENDLIGNVDIELKLDEKGKFRLKAFSHAADQYSNYLDNTQRNGAGFVYQEEFNTFGQLWRRWWKLP